MFGMAPIPKIRTFDDLTGRRFNRLTIISYEGQVAGGAAWLARCDCGNEKVVKRKHLLSGKQQSCGCLRNEKHPMQTHGRTKTPEYRAWKAMKGRCLSPTNKRYEYYGGRGIQVCDEWRDSFEAFLCDMGPRPSDEHSLDRIDPDGNYEPGNVRWADKLTQLRNRRNVARATINGETKTLTEWAKEYGISPELVRSRVKDRGWELMRALTTDPNEYHNRSPASAE